MSLLNDPGVQSVDMGGKRVWTKPDVNGWQPIETARKDRYLLLWSADTGCCVGYWREGLGWCDNQTDQCGDYIEVEGVTHWMPLPSPPQQ